MSTLAPEITLPERYRVTGRIAAGGMASVWEAEDQLLGRKVAVKVLASHLSQDARIAERFHREARLAASLSSHPHVVTIFDVGEHDGRAFIVMERLSGGSVADAMRRRHGYVPRHQTLRWLREAGEALDAAHRHRIVHRDIKPGNLLLDERLHVKIADFGIARLTDGPTLTASGELFGTAAYLSPEQARGEPASPASDRYALAVVAYELLTGHKPFEADNFAAQARAHIEDAPPAPSTRVPGELPGEVDAVLLRGLAKDPGARWPSSASFVSALERALEGVASRETDATQVLAAPPEPQAEEPTVTRIAPPVGRRPVRRRRGNRLAPLVLVAIGALAVLAVVLASSGGGGGSSPSASRTAPARAKAGTPAKPKARTTPVAPPSTSTTPRTTSTAAPPASGSASALNAQGFALLGAGRPAEAIAPLQGAVRACGSSTALDPCGYAAYNLGHALRLAGRPGEAIPFLERRLRFPGQHDVVQRELDAARAQAGGGAPPSRSPGRPGKHQKKHHENRGGGHEGGD
jgi:eukaryotic-like serine/threonine-protein kinase